MPLRAVTRRKLADDLRRLGIEAGDLVIVHSSLSSLGSVDGGAETVVQALLDVLTPSGTLAAPTFGGPQPFDAKTNPSGLGAISEELRKWPGAARSIHPTHSVSAVGARAAELVKDHFASPTAAGRETPYGRIIEWGGKILLLGVDNDRNTTLHTLEEYVEAPYLSDREASYLDENGRERVLKMKLFPGPHRDFIGLGPLLRRSGVEVVAKVGNAVARLIDAKRMRDVVLEAFGEDPALVLCDNPNCEDCLKQRREIRLARLREEDFTLSALASSISPYPDEIAVEMSRAGISDLIADRLYGRPIWQVPERRLRSAASTFADEGIRVGAVHGPADAAALGRAFEAASVLGAGACIVPFPADLAPFVDAARSAGIEILFENAAFPASVCDRLLKAADLGEAFAFNPAAFALIGEKPFLQAFSDTRIRKHIRVLYLTDATFGGAYTLPGRGNGGVKELLSIMRCRSFAGRVVVGTGPGGPPFRDLVEAFWSLLGAL